MATPAGLSRGTTRLESAVLAFEAVLACSMTYGGPVYVAVAVLLILAVGCVFFAAVLPLVMEARGTWRAAGHGAVGAGLLGNVLLNYWLCVTTSPGFTTDVPAADFEAAPPAPRFCDLCNCPKPPLAHHCHICAKCVLRMDHHCPWMANCVGHGNYQQFFLMITYLWLGSLYSAAMTIEQLKAAHAREAPEPTPIAFAMVLSVSVGTALTLLVAWHTYLILTAQSTIDFYQNRKLRQAARASGGTWVNPYDLGPAANWQETFDVCGMLWWLRWLLPSLRRKQGSGLAFPTSAAKIGRHDGAATREHAGL